MHAYIFFAHIINVIVIWNKI